MPLARRQIPVGTVFGRWTVIGAAADRREAVGHLRQHVRCRCGCGTERDVGIAQLRRGGSLSCGCDRRGRGPSKYPSARKSAIGEVHGWLTVTAEAADRMQASGRARYVVVRCACGTVKEVPLASLRDGRTVSCGCWSRKRSTVHGMRHTRTYKAWHSMHDRCNARTGPLAAGYRDRGISVCERWTTFPPFYEDMGACMPGMTLDRIDNNRGYEPGNCRWVDMKVQNRNRRGNVWLVYRGTQMCLKDACASAGVSQDSVIRKVRAESITHQAAFDLLSTRVLALRGLPR